MFLEVFRKRDIDLGKLINLHTDSCSVLRGKKSGAVMRIASVAAKIIKSDIGGDALHHVHNSVKKAFHEVFPNLNTLLKCIKYDIRSSPAKIEEYLETCDKVGEPKKMPVSYCVSRFLDKYKAVSDTIEHINTFKEFYKDESSRYSGNSDSDDDKDTPGLDLDLGEVRKGESDNHEKTENWKGNPNRRREILKKSFGVPKEAILTEIELIVARDSLKLPHDFLRIFQAEDVKIHLLYDAMKELLRSTLQEIAEPAGLVNSKGEKLDGKELKSIILETKEERIKRRLEGSNSQEETESRSRLKLRKSTGVPQRHCQLLPVEGTCLDKALRDALDSLMRKYGVPDDEKNKILLEVKSTKYKFNIELTKSYQHYLPLGNDFLRRLKFLCPKSFIEKQEAEHNVIKIAKEMDMIDSNEEDSLRLEIRKIKGDKDILGEGLQVYIERFVKSFRLNGKEPNIPIDSVWNPIIVDEAQFPCMSRLLRGSLSIFHSTATVEGAINTTRNILNERAHQMLDENLNARKHVKSAVKNSGKCCYDFDVNGPSFKKNWYNSRGEYMKIRNKENCNDSSGGEDDDLENQEKDKDHENNTKDIESPSFKEIPKDDGLKKTDKSKSKDNDDKIPCKDKDIVPSSPRTEIPAARRKSKSKLSLSKSNSGQGKKSPKKRKTSIIGFFAQFKKST